jgi:hypothetical protein
MIMEEIGFWIIMGIFAVVLVSMASYDAGKTAGYWKHVKEVDDARVRKMNEAKLAEDRQIREWVKEQMKKEGVQ